MSRYPRVKPRPSRPQPTKTADEALNQDARKLYRLKGGDFIEASIQRLEKLLALHDREMAQLEADELANKKRWLVSPTMVLRLQRELERYHALRAELIEQVFQLASQGAPAPDVPQVTSTEPTQPSPAGQEGGQANPAVTAAA
ncbi:MAG: hypothetical protein H6840_10175 [Planctomycetes bacterium]|nr:hypothetical protein [Planctomycetota bacterium]